MFAFVMAGLPTHAEETCKNLDNGATDSFDDSCDWYDKYPGSCGRYDDDDFTAKTMCCACSNVESNWIIGEMNQPCDEVCRIKDRYCDPRKQSQITSIERFKEVMVQIGHTNCKEFKHRGYAGAPLLANDGTTCVYLTPNGRSVCHKVTVKSHQPLCYCRKPEPGEPSPNADPAPKGKGPNGKGNADPAPKGKGPNGKGP